MDQVPAQNEPMTREEALKRLGLYARHDKVSGWLTAGLVAGAGYYLINQHDTTNAILMLLGAILMLLQLILVVAYRIAVFVLDTHGEISLMPEAAARIAVAYLAGKNAPTPAAGIATVAANLNRRPPGP